MRYTYHKFITIPYHLHIMKKINTLLFYSLICSTIHFYGMQPAASYLVVVKKPVIELNNSFPAPKNLPISPETKGCPRAHQALFNEIAECHECQDENIKVTFPQVIYGYDEQTQTVRNTFWGHAQDMIPLTQLSSSMKNSIPPSEYAQAPTIVLTYPWNYYSMGTRFIHVRENDTKDSYAIIHPNFETNSSYLDFVPHEDAIEEVANTPVQARNLFVTLINNIIDRVQKEPHQVIPYAWGGSSFVQLYEDEAFYQQDGAWHRKEKNDPYSGYDCSEFVMRMAKIAGISFPWKTSTAIERGLKKLSASDQLKDGDIMWVPGHVMIVSNIKNNELIEARSYSVGYGCVHRLKLENCFENVKTYADLLEHYCNNKPVRFKNKAGDILPKEYVLTFLKLL